MSQRQFIILLTATIFSSFLGGMSIQFLTQVPPVSAKESTNYPDEIKTRAIHLVGRDNRVRASFYMGVQDAPQLVLYDKEGTNRFNLGLAPAGNSGMSFNDNDFNKLVDIETSYDRGWISISDSKKNIVWQTPHSK